MSVKPILFNTEMVRAILDNRKTATRRAVKCSHRDAAGFNIVKNGNGEIVGVMDYDDDERSYEDYTIPPYRPGDILWVRETWARMMNGDYWYKADGKDETDIGLKIKWRPSIHMPREAARIWLRVTGVRVERLQAISYEDLQREGGKSDFYKVKRCRACGYGEPHYPECDYEHCDNYERLWEESFLQPFIKLWDSTIKPADRDRYGWDANPFCWVISFERCEKPEEEK